MGDKMNPLQKNAGCFYRVLYKVFPAVITKVACKGMVTVGAVMNSVG